MERYARMGETNRRESIVEEEGSSDMSGYRGRHDEANCGKVNLENPSMLSSGSLSLEWGVNTYRK